MPPVYTIKIDNLSFYAQQVSLEQPFVENSWEEVKIHRGNPKFYVKEKVLRKMSFSTVMYGNITTNREKLATIVNKKVSFTSTFIGTFNAHVIVKIDYEDGVKDVTGVSFTVQEII